jgi:hypothetical protein
MWARVELLLRRHAPGTNSSSATLGAILLGIDPPRPIRPIPGQQPGPTSQANTHFRVLKGDTLEITYGISVLVPSLPFSFFTSLESWPCSPMLNGEEIRGEAMIL